MNDRIDSRVFDEALARQATSSRYSATRAASMALAAPLSAEDCLVQSMPDASPVKWHLAHTSWFFETFILIPHDGSYRAFDPAYRVLFNSYYNAVGDKHPRPQRGLLSRPSLAEVLAYRRHIDTAMASLLDRGALSQDVAPLLELGIQHEQQHQELILTDVKHLLSLNPLRPSYVEPRMSAQSPGSVPELRWLPFAEGVVEIGHRATGFAFDNESPRHRSFLNAFELASRPVTNGEYMAFIEDGGYRRPELWLSDGWDWVGANDVAAPLYWERESDHPRTQFTLSGLAPLDAAAAVCHASYYEADAYARWSNARLPTEAEWETAVAGIAVEGNFVENGALQPLRGRAEGHGLQQAYGDVWEWTQSPYAAYPGYRPAAGAVGEYNSKFMCNQFVLRGGSCATPQEHVRPSYRNFFPAGARWQFSGIRLARDAG